MTRKLTALLAGAFSLLPPTAARAAAPAADSSVPTESREQHGARMSWWREARFGMFIHWGLYSVPAGI